MASTTKRLRALAKKLMVAGKDAKKIVEDDGSVMNRIIRTNKMGVAKAVADGHNGVVAVDFTHALTTWDGLGAPTFALGQQSTGAFALTEIADVDASEIVLPFDSILVSLSDSPLVIPKFNERIEYIFAFRGRGSYYRDLFTRRISNEQCVGEHHKRVIDKMFDDAADKIRSDESLDPEQRRDRTSEAVYNLEEKIFGSRESIVIIGFAIDSEKVTSVEVIVDPAVGKTIGECFLPTCSEDAIHVARGIARIVCNLCLYLDNSGSSGTPKYDRERLKDTRERRVDNATVWNVCSEIRIDKKLVETARERYAANRDPITWKLKSRQLVRGHWKMQHHGHSRSLRKRIFVQPYMRGDDYNEQRERIYTAK